MAKRASGKYAYLIDDRSGRKIRYKDARTEWNGLRVYKKDWEPKHPQLTPPKLGPEATSLDNPRPDVDSVPTTVRLGSLFGRGTPNTVSSFGRVNINVAEEAVSLLMQTAFSVPTIATGYTLIGEALSSARGSVTINTAEDADSQLLQTAFGSFNFSAQENVSGENLQTGLGPTNSRFTAEGNAQLSTAQQKFGTASLLLDGTDDYVESDSSIDLSSSDFTIDLWIRPDNVTGYKGIWQSGTSTTEQSYLLGNQVYWTVTPSTIITSSVTVSAGVWTMLSYERQGNTHRIYKNGTLEDTFVTANRQDNGTFSVGKNGFGDFDGYIDEVRVSDTARYAGSSFTEPASAFIVDGSTDVLLHFDGTNGSTTITNAAENIPVTVSVSSNAELIGQSLASAQGSTNFSAQENVDGQSSATAHGTLTFQASSTITSPSQSAATGIGTPIINTGEDADGLQLSSGFGTISIAIDNSGWGVDSWGANAWGT